MAGDPSDKIPEAIKDHKPKQTLEMNTPGGRGLQKANAEKKDFQSFTEKRRSDAQRLAKMDKYKAPEKENVREGNKNMVRKEFNKEVER
ncbi:hypothetical protein ACR9YC_12700 [Parasphingorhabdus sp. DH2-15]|uniref:hypothetical protein n=1 Tax=Parasphingorhabdus sp. DH2-15 TaxID=3444112 RepID=UPI003F686F77